MSREELMRHLTIDLVNVHMAERRRDAERYRRHRAGGMVDVSVPEMPTSPTARGWGSILHAFRAVAATAGGRATRA
jgi:hypothetical protein